MSNESPHAAIGLLMTKYLISILLGIFGPSFSSGAAVSPSIHWKSMSSAHFDLIYDAQQQELAQIYLDRLERARGKLEKVWVYVPEHLTIAVSDRTDLTNGYATPLPFAQVMVFPVLPGPEESISEYGDWAEEILIHELTHIMTFEQRRGGVEFLSNIFGNIITPNMMLPNWWMEGLAVDAETRYSNFGRLRSNYQDATLRALVTSPRWSDLRYTEINEPEIPTWPYGSRPYLYGSVLWSEMISLKGEKIVGKIHDRLGGRFPWFLGAPVEDTFGEDMDLSGLFAQTKLSLQKLVSNQKEKLQKVPFTTFQKLQDEDFLETLSPRISPDGLKMAFLAKDDTLKRSIQVLARPSTQVSFDSSQRMRSFGQKTEVNDAPNGIELKIPRDSPPTGTINRIAWKTDSQSFIFDLVSERDIFHDVSDLWVFNLQTGKADQITKNLRAREPDLSPSGEKVAFVKLEAGRTALGIYDLKAKKATILYRGPLLSRVAWPVWLGEDRILFTLREKGTEQFGIWDLTYHKVDWPKVPFKEVSLPFLKDSHVYFVSNQNGVRNLYQTDLGFKSTSVVSHLWTGAYAGDFDSQKSEIWLTELGDRGFEMVHYPLPSPQTRPTSLPNVEPLLIERYPAHQESPLAQVTPKETEDYSPASYLRPRYWIPFFYWDDKGVQGSFLTSGSDPLNIHSYSLFGSYDSATKQGSYQAVYQNQSFVPTLTFESSDLRSYLADPNQTTRTQYSFVQSAWEISPISAYLFAFAGWNWLTRDQFAIRTYQSGPSLGLTYQNYSQTGEQISPESGWGSTLSSTEYYQEDWISRYNLSQFSLQKFGKFPWAHHHAWLARVMAQSIDRDVPISNYEGTYSTLTVAPLQTQPYLMRGYVTGGFLGKSIANTNLEYRFPITRIDRGGDHFAFFLQRISAALVYDAIWLQGYAYDTSTNPKIYRQTDDFQGFSDVGGEVKFDMTLGYHFGIQLVLGVYEPLALKYSDSNPRFGLYLGL